MADPKPEATPRARLEAEALALFRAAKRANDPNSRDTLSRKALDLATVAEALPLDTIAARKAAIGDTYDALEAARRLLAAGYDEPCLLMVVKGELS